MNLYRWMYPLQNENDGSGGDGTGGTNAAGGNAAGEGGAGGAKTGGDDKGGDKGGKKEYVWGEGWREQLAKGDEKVLGRLQRFNTPEDIFTSYRALEQRMHSGELKSALPKDAKPEDVAKWRTENGIPETPDKYNLDLGDGLVVGDEDKPIVEGFLKAAHESNLSNDAVKTALGWYYREVERQTDERAKLDDDIKTKTEDALRVDWGQDYRTNMNRVNSLIATMPADVRDLFMHGRLADGTPVGASPGVLKSLALWHRQINPTHTIVPGDGANIGSAIEDEIKTIEKVMRTDRKAYNKDEKMQLRYRELLDARSRFGDQQKTAGATSR